MIDGTEKPEIPLKFAKRAARFNEFGYNTFLTINWLTIYFNVQGIVYLFLCALDHIFESREDKADRKGIPHTHPIP